MLPDLSETKSKAMRATGTDGRQISLPVGLLPERGFERISAESGGVKMGGTPGRENLGNTLGNAVFTGENGRGRSGIRTHEITDLQSVPLVHLGIRPSARDSN